MFRHFFYRSGYPYLENTGLLTLPLFSVAIASFQRSPAWLLRMSFFSLSNAAMEFTELAQPLSY